MRIPLFLIKYTHYEYWPMWLFYIPALPYWLYLSIKNKSLAYFTSANPGIELGGFFGESKSDIFKLLDKQYLPNSIEVENCDSDTILKNLEKQNMQFPIIAKPDIGERGDHVAKLNSEKELVDYNAKAAFKYILQEFITYEIELGILYSRLPNSSKGNVSSITLKEFLTVIGDGDSTIMELMQQNTRARFQIDRLLKEKAQLLNSIPEKNEKVLLEPIGNHCRGTRFIDNNYLINERLNSIFDAICIPIEGFYYGRFDLKVKSIEDLHLGKNIKIMELNGASSEPGHIYDSTKNNIFRAYIDLFSHWRRLSDIATQNIQKGHKPVSFVLIVKSYLKFVILKNNSNLTIAHTKY